MRAGPKAIPTGAPLPLHELPAGGSARVAAFVESYCRVVKGGAGNPAGALIRLRPWQRDILAGLYDPSPRPRQGLVSVARKNGKSLLGASLALYHLLGDGEESAEVLLASSDEATARVIFHVARRMVELDERLSGVLQTFQSRLVHPASDSTLETLPGFANLVQGRNPSCSIVDECHVTPPDVWDAVALAGGTRSRPLTLGLSTECGPGDPDNLMARLVDHGRRGDDPAFAFTEFTAPAGCALDDRDAWAAANPQLGDTLDPEHLASVLKTTREPAFRRFHLNQRVAAAGAWLPAGAWDACRSTDRIADGADVVLGFDGSYRDDSTALVVGTVDAHPLVDVVKVWAAPAADDDWRVPIADVEETIRAACRRWHVIEIVCDPYRWARSMQILEAEGLPVVEFPWSPRRLTPATTDLYRAILAGEIRHTGNPILAEHVTNAVVAEDGHGVRLAKEGRHTKRKVDAAAALLMTYSRATWRSRKQKKRRARSFA